MSSVALFTRAWIEIGFSIARISVSLVALFTRAWIEITPPLSVGIFALVALFTRAWIEILPVIWVKVAVFKSPSSRGRGLKYRYHICSR